MAYTGMLDVLSRVYTTAAKGKKHVQMDTHIQKDSCPLTHTLTNNLVHHREYTLIISLIDKVLDPHLKLSQPVFRQLQAAGRAHSFSVWDMGFGKLNTYISIFQF